MRTTVSLVCLLLAVSAMSVYAAEELPDGWKTSEEPFVGPSPIPVMEQVFWVQLPTPPEVAMAVTPPEGVTLLDHTQPGQKRGFTRYYFRADCGLRDVSIQFKPAEGEAFGVPLRVKTYREDITEHTMAIPDLDPGARKLGRSYYTDGMIATARENIEKYPDLATTIEAATAFDGKSDEELWAYYPSWNVPRDCYANWPCPKCGEIIFKHSGFYPWTRGSARPYKATCPECGQHFPTNDWANDDFTSGEYPDDGWGWDPGTGRADAMAWVSHYLHHVTWQSGGGIERLGLRSLLLGDREAAHRAGVLLARLAYVYPGLDFRWQQARTGYLDRRGRALIDGNWERNNLLVPALRAYDAIWEYLDEDTALVEFLHTKDPEINTADDVKALFDRCLVQVFGWDWMRRELGGGNQGAREQDFAEMIACANMGPISDRWLEELFTHAYNSNQNRGGFDDATLVNALTREGHTLVSGLGYAIGYLQSKSDMAETLSRVQTEKWAARANLYDEKAYPKLRAEYDLWIDMTVAGELGPQYGDSGEGRTARYPSGLASIRRQAYERAYRRWPDDRIARAIHRGGKAAPSLFEPDVWPEVQKHVERVGPEPPLRSRVIDGAGFVMLESRPDAQTPAERAGVAFRYGYGQGHQHQDNLNVEFFARGESLSPDLGYPCWAHPLGATGDTVHHCTGMFDRSRQHPGAIGKGWLEMFAGGPEASFADVAAAPGATPTRLFRRAVCLADAPEGNAYLFDVLRMAGGTKRTYCFHGPMHDEFTTNLQFGPKSPEPFALTSVSRRLSNNIHEPQQAALDADAWADWKFKGADTHIRLDLLAAPGRQYYTAVYAKTDVPDIRFLFAEDEVEDGAGEFVAIWQAYGSAPFIEKIERLPVDGAAEGEFGPVAVRVTCAGGQVDRFIYTYEPDTPLSVDGIGFQGSFGYWSELNGEPRCVRLVNGTKLVKSGRGVVDAVPRFTAKATAVDHVNRIITLDDTLPVGDALAGQMIYFTSGPHRSAYHIVEVLEPGNMVRFDLDGLVYRSRIDAAIPDNSGLVVEMPFVLPGSGNPDAYSYYDGAYVTGEDFKAAYRVKGIERGEDNSSSKLLLDRAVDINEFPDADGDGRQMVYIYDMGPGDDVTVHNSVFVDYAAGKAVAAAGAKIEGIQP